MSDLISRRKAIDALHKEIMRRRLSEDSNDDGALDEFDTEAILRQLPSIQPEQSIVEWQKDFQEYISTLNIQRDDYRGIMEYIDEVPPAEAEPRKRGQWVNIREMGEGQWYGECNCCWHLRHIDEYCSNCGAKMDEVEE